MKSDQNVVNLKLGVGGLFRIDAKRLDGEGNVVSSRELAPWQDNLITNGGMEMFKAQASSMRNFCHVGSGSAPPAFTDSNLQAWVRSSDTLNGGTTSGVTSTAPYYYFSRRVYRFAAGTAAGNLSEVGLAPAGGSSSPLFSRAFIRDSGGLPTTITVLPDEVLDVTYEVRMYIDTGDVSGSVVLDGVTYATTTRRAMVAGGNAFTNAFLAGSWFKSDFSNETGTHVFTGTIGAFTDGPSGTKGTNAFNAGGVTTPGATGQYWMETESTWELAQGNLAGGIRSYLPASQLGAFQVQFDPAIPKDNTKRLKLKFRWTWERYTP